MSIMQKIKFFLLNYKQHFLQTQIDNKSKFDIKKVPPFFWQALLTRSFRAKTAGGPPAVLGRLLSVQKQSPQDCGAIPICFPVVQAV